MSRGYAEESYQDGWWGKLKEKMGVGEYEEDEYDEGDSPEPSRRRGGILRLHVPRQNEISIRLNVESLDDAKDAADRLKARQSVILNLEHTDDETAERVVDFISGVTYALDGYYQKVGEKVFLFTPENTAISVEETPSRLNRGR
jgi:cell division inhibitor SepF